MIFEGVMIIVANQLEPMTVTADLVFIRARLENFLPLLIKQADLAKRLALSLKSSPLNRAFISDS